MSIYAGDILDVLAADVVVGAGEETSVVDGQQILYLNQHFEFHWHDPSLSILEAALEWIFIGVFEKNE